MALARFVVTQKVTLPPDGPAIVVAGEPATGGVAGFGNAATLAAPTTTKFGLWGNTIEAGTVIWADSAAGVQTGAQVLYQAIGAANLRAYVQGQDDVGHAALSN